VSWRSERSKTEARRTSGVGSSRFGTFFARSGGSDSRSQSPISRTQRKSSPRARKRSPAASGAVIARTCRSATSRTSTSPKATFGMPGIEPSMSRLTSSIDVEGSGPSSGPSTATGLTTASSGPAPLLPTKSHAARSAIVFDFA
jgi:hypothetical protein